MSWRTGTPRELKERTGEPTLEEAFIALLPEEKRPPRTQGAGGHAARGQRRAAGHRGPGLTQRFGNFTAVDHVNFRIERGEIFGFLGSNGCGKIDDHEDADRPAAADRGRGAELFGKPVKGGDVESRRSVGYMTQAFSLYTELTVRQNLVLHARLFDFPKEEGEARVEKMLAERFGLAVRGRHAAGEPAAGHAATALAGRGCHSRTGDTHTRRADVRGRPGGARRFLGIADRPVARARRDDLRVHPFHERGRALRPHVA